MAGRMNMGIPFGRLAAFARYGGSSGSSHYSGSVDDENSDSVESEAEKQTIAKVNRQVEYFVDLGMSSSQVDYEQDAGAVPADKSNHSSAHIGLGFRRAMNHRNDLGTRIEFDNVAGKLIYGLAGSGLPTSIWIARSRLISSWAPPVTKR